MTHGENEFSEPLEGAINPGGENIPPIPVGQDNEAAERWWIDNVYRGDKMRQISPRAILSGMLIGGLMSVSIFTWA